MTALARYALFLAVVLDDEFERRGLAALVLELVDARLGHAGHARAEVQHGRDLGCRGQRLEVALDDLIAGRVPVSGRRFPAVAREQLGGDGVDVVLPG